MSVNQAYGENVGNPCPSGAEPLSEDDIIALRSFFAKNVAITKIDICLGNTSNIHSFKSNAFHEVLDTEEKLSNSQCLRGTLLSFKTSDSYAFATVSTQACACLQNGGSEGCLKCATGCYLENGVCKALSSSSGSITIGSGSDLPLLKICLCEDEGTDVSGNTVCYSCPDNCYLNSGKCYFKATTKCLLANCAACDSNGVCTACDRGYELINGMCNVKLDPIESSTKYVIRYYCKKPVN